MKHASLVLSVLARAGPIATVARAGYATVAAPSADTAKRVQRRIIRTLELPKAPKRPGSAYAQFVSAKYPKLAQSAEHKGKGLAPVARELASMWKSASAAEKQTYESKYSDALADYNKKLKAFHQNLSISQRMMLSREAAARRALGLKASKVPRDPSRPKAPAAPHVLFLKEKLSSPSDVQRIFGGEASSLSAPKKLSKILSIWRGMSSDSRAPYEQSYAKAKQAYQTKLKAYKEQTSAERKKATNELSVIARAAKRHVTPPRKLKKKVVKKAKKAKKSVVRRVKSTASKIKSAAKSMARGTKAVINKTLGKTKAAAKTTGKKTQAVKKTVAGKAKAGAAAVKRTAARKN